MSKNLAFTNSSNLKAVHAEQFEKNMKQFHCDWRLVPTNLRFARFNATAGQPPSSISNLVYEKIFLGVWMSNDSERKLVDWQRFA